MMMIMMIMMMIIIIIIIIVIIITRSMTSKAFVRATRQTLFSLALINQYYCAGRKALTGWLLRYRTAP